MARPTVMTEEVIAKLEEAFAWGCTDIEACLWADIGEKTLYNYQEKHPEFLQRKEALKQTPVMKARKAVTGAFSSDPKLALQYLERKKKDEFSLKTEQEHTSPDGSMTPTVRIIDERISSDE